MSNAQLLFTVFALQQGLIMAFWLVAAQVRLAHGAALHWAAGAALVVVSMGLILSRPQFSPWLTVVGANLALLAALVVNWRGIRVFTRKPFSEHEPILVLSAGALGLTAAMAADAGMVPIIMVSGATMCWALMRSAHELRRNLTQEFGQWTATWCAAPLAVIGLLLGLRGLLAPLAPDQVGRAIEQDTVANFGVILGSIAFTLVLNMALTALVVLRLVRKLQHRSDHDTLTGLLSRRPLQARLQTEAERLSRYGSGYAMLSIDIDHFKRINDERGHAAGDAVLVRVAHTLRDAARQVDSVARMGGEEFCMLLPEADRRGAQAVAQRVLDAVRALEHPELGPDWRVTVSVGLAVVASPVESEQALLRRLDRALYRAKTDGRNRVVEADPTLVPVAGS